MQVNPGPSGETGFALMAPQSTGVVFTNELKGDAYLTNPVAHNGSGVAIGDVDGNGLADIYLCNLQGPNRLFFNLVDPESKRVLPVAYRDVKPANFEEAVSIVAIGRYQADSFHAEKLLVKCPSKYQGQETEKHYGAKVSVRS